jgi:hypothetical protein
VSIGCTKSISVVPISISYPEFVDETEVIVNGYQSDTLMEPFITKDGLLLFFNNYNDGINTSLYYAVRSNDTNFIFAGEIAGVNGTSPHLDAVSSMDMHNTFYFVSARNYPTVIENLQSGQFNNGTTTNVLPVFGNFYINLPGWLIMDAEISKDGNQLYYVNAKLSGQTLPDEAILGIAVKQDSVFNKSNTSDDVLRNINNSDYLVYAPCISSDGREIYFTKMKKGTTIAEIFVSVRTDINEVFSVPKKIDILGNLAEAPTLTDDGKRLYFHKRLNDGKYNIFTMKRKN